MARGMNSRTRGVAQGYTDGENISPRLAVSFEAEMFHALQRLARKSGRSVAFHVRELVRAGMKAEA